MYPKVFTEFNTLARRYGPVSVLPTPTFFYGMEPGQEITVEIERGKTWWCRLLTLGEADEEGQVKVFFELNGQQRIIKVPNRKLAARWSAAAKPTRATTPTWPRRCRAWWSPSR